MKKLMGRILWEPLPIKTRTWRRINEFLWRVWIVLTVYTFMSDLKQSIPWLAFMSGYAIVASHMAAVRADSPDDKS